MIGVVEVLKVSQQIIEANRMSSPNAAFGIYLVVFLLYFFRMLANQYACKISGKKMEVIDRGRDITYSRTSDKKYGDQVILDDVSLDVKKGEVIVVVGPSGCGKSTLLRCINALEPIQGGVVKLGDEVIDPKSKSLTCLRQKIGMVFQSYDLFPHLTVLDNILLAPTKVQKRSKDEVKEEA